jgi:hypothetical protein
MKSPVDPSLAPPQAATLVPPMELVCPAGSLPALKAAIDHGADCVYLGFRDATNARNFAGLNFDEAAIATGIRYAHERGRKVLLALNTYPQAASPETWRKAIDRAADNGVNAVILADPGLMAYAVKHHPDLRLHLSVQGFGHQLRGHQFLPPAFWRRTCRATTCAVDDPGGTSAGKNAGRNRGVWLWQPVRDGGGALRRYPATSRARRPTPTAYARHPKPCAGKKPRKAANRASTAC